MKNLFKNFELTQFPTIPYRSTYHEGIRSKLFFEADKYGLIPIAEYPIFIETPNYKRKNRKGKIDLVWANKKGKAIYAFEIDFSIKNSSLLKLKEVNAKHKYWLLVLSSKKKKQYKEKLGQIPKNITVILIDSPLG